MTIPSWRKEPLEIVAPPVPAFYNHPQSVEELVDHTVGRVLDLFGLEMPQVKRWAGMRP